MTRALKAVPTPRGAKKGMTLFERLVLAKTAADDAKKAYDDIKAEVAQANDFGTHAEGDIKVRVQHNRTLNKDLAFAQYGEKACELVVTPNALKKFLGTEQLDALYVEGAPTVIIVAAG